MSQVLQCLLLTTAAVHQSCTSTTMPFCMVRQRFREEPASTVINHSIFSTSTLHLHRSRMTTLLLLHLRRFYAHVRLVMTTNEKTATPHALASPQTTAVPALTSPSTTSSNASSKSPPATSKWYKFRSIVTYTPVRCRYDPAKPPGFSLPLNLLFSFAATFTGTGIAVLSAIRQS